jgi:hypothetical protein
MCGHFLISGIRERESNILNKSGKICRKFSIPYNSFQCTNPLFYYVINDFICDLKPLTNQTDFSLSKKSYNYRKEKIWKESAAEVQPKLPILTHKQIGR